MSPDQPNVLATANTNTNTDGTPLRPANSAADIPAAMRAPARGFSYGLHVLRVRPTNGRTGASRSRSRYTRHGGKKECDRHDAALFQYGLRYAAGLVNDSL